MVATRLITDVPLNIADNAVYLHVPRGVSAAGALPVRLPAARRCRQVAQRAVRTHPGSIRYVHSPEKTYIENTYFVES